MRNKNYLFPSLILVLVLAYSNYFKDYSDIKHPVWDEKFHIPAAEKYLEEVAFLDSHPPLGKMIIALGENLLKANKDIDKSGFLDKACLKKFPEGFNYSGFRFFPAICSVLSACLFLLIFYQISKRLLISVLFTLFYIFENSFIVHSRVGTTDSIQVFFMLLAVLYFIYLFKQKGHIRLSKYAGLAIIVGLCTTIKLTGLIGILLFIPLFIRERYKILRTINKHSINLKKKILWDLSKKIIIVSFTLTLVICAVFSLHIYLGNKSLDTQDYQLPQRYVNLINNKQHKSLLNLPYMISANIKFMFTYNGNISKRLKYDRTEAGSHPLNWLLGGKAPPYLEAKINGNVIHLIPLGNPIVWLGCLLSVMLAVILVFGKFIFNIKITNYFYFNLLVSFLFLYLSYMTVMLRIERVMYLHHYYIPLFFSLIISFLIFNYIFDDLLIIKDKIVYVSISLLVIQSLICFYFFYPLTYYQEMTRYEFKQRMWIEAWGLEHVK